jgi:hypothetical protein
MTIEGQGGAVGFVKSGAKVRLSDEAGGSTLLTYEVDAQVGGRLAQLGGPIIDATAKQMAGRFFQQFGTIVGTPAAVAGEAPAAITAAAAARAPHAAAPATAGFSMSWLLALAIAALVGYLVGHSSHAGTDTDWMGLSIGLLVLIVGAAGFEFGRRTATPVVMLDPAVFARISEETKR